MNQQHLSHAQIAELLCRLETFRDLSKDCLRQLALAGRQFSLKQGEPLFEPGDAARDLYVVISGRVKVFLSLKQGSEKLISMVERGSCIGAAPVCLGVPHMAHAVANKDSHLIAINRDILMQCAHRDAALACRLLTAVAHYKLHLLQDLQSCTPHSALERLACYLLQQRPRPEACQYEIILTVTKKDLAAMLNIAQETLSRVLRQMCDDGLIAVQGRLIRVLDADRLTADRPVVRPTRTANPDFGNRLN